MMILYGCRLYACGNCEATLSIYLVQRVNWGVAVVISLTYLDLWWLSGVTARTLDPMTRPAI